MYLYVYQKHIIVALYSQLLFNLMLSYLAHDSVVKFQTTCRARGVDKDVKDRGLTPLGLACKLGRRRMFDKALELQNKFNLAHPYDLYELNAIDTIGEGGKFSKFIFK